MLPGASSFRVWVKFGEPEFALLLVLAARHIDVFDLGPALLAALGQHSYCEIHAARADCAGQFGIAAGGVA